MENNNVKTDGQVLFEVLMVAEKAEAKRDGYRAKMEEFEAKYHDLSEAAGKAAGAREDARALLETEGWGVYDIDAALAALTEAM